MVPVLTSIISLLLADAVEEAEREGLVVVKVLRIVAALFLVLSAYSWVCVFVPRWRHGHYRNGRPIGTSGFAGLAIVTAGWGLALIVMTMYPDIGPQVGRIIGLILLMSCLGLAIGTSWDR
jgi:hypothetical protein